MLFLYSQNTGIAPTLSHPLREVFVLATRIAINSLLGLGTTYPQEQVSYLNRVFDTHEGVINRRIVPRGPTVDFSLPLSSPVLVLSS